MKLRIPLFGFPVLNYLSSRCNQIANSPMRFLLAYFALIPIFAVIYSVFAANDFVHSNLKLENSFQSDIQNSLLRVQQAIKETLQSKARLNKGYFFADVENIRFANGTYHFSLIFEPHPPLADSDARKKGFVRRYTYHCRNFSLPPIDRASVEYIMLDSEYVEPLCKVQYRNLGEPPLISEWFEEPQSAVNISPATTSNFNTPEAMPPIPADSDTFAFYEAHATYRIESILSGNDFVTYMSNEHQNLTKGQYSRISWGLFGRMFYFSAVTITTLGFGDIAPISNFARMLVTLESVLGILLIGLFFHAIATENSQRRR